MTPEDLAGFASNVAVFSPDQIDGVHRVLFRLQEEAAAINATNVAQEWRALALEEQDEDEGPLDFIQELLLVDARVPLADKFLDVLEEANIVLTTASSLRADSPESIPSIDENDPLWRQAVAIDNRKLATQSLDLWRDGLHGRRQAYLDFENAPLNATADLVYEHNLARRALANWREQVYDIKEMEQRADAFRRRKDAAFGLRALTLAARESMLKRVRDQRAAEKFLGKWRAKTAEIKSMNVAADDFRTQQAARNVLGRLVQKSNEIKQAESQAMLIYEGNLAQTIFTKWFSSLQRIQEMERKADAAADFHAGKHVFRRILARARQKLQEKEILKARTHILSFKYFHKWRAFTKRSKDAKYNEAYKTIRRKVKMNIGRTVLQIWNAKAKEKRGMETIADEFRARKDEEKARRTAHGAIVTMYNRTEQIQAANVQADQIYIRNLFNRYQILGDNWIGQTRQILENQRIADEYHATRTESYALGTLKNWRNAAFRAKRLEEDAEALRQRNERKYALGVLQRWRSAAASRANDDGEAMDNSLVPATPAARRSQLLASTTPAYTPATGLFGTGSRVEEVDEDEDDG